MRKPTPPYRRKPTAPRHYDLKRIEPHLNDKTLNAILVRDFNKFTFGRCNKPFRPGQFPRDYESCDWWVGHRGPEPRFWRYVKHSTCHWLVNFNLRLAQLVEPSRPWRILTSQEHSTVWDGEQTLFDFNFLALGITPDEYFRLANKRQLRIGEQLKVYYADHFSKD